MLYYLTIGLAIPSSLVDHGFIELTPGGVHPEVSLIATYATALATCFGLLLFFPLKARFGHSLRQLNWASYALAGALVGLEIGFLLAYRAGWRIGRAAMLVNVIVAILLLPVGLVLFEEQLSAFNVPGVVVTVIGLAMMNAR